MSSTHIFVDESKHRNYLLVAATVVPGDLEPLRKLVRAMVLPRQRRLHMAKESDSRRKVIADAICAAEVTSMVYTADAGTYRRELDARYACLQALVRDTNPNLNTRIILEQDDSLIDWDRRQLYTLTRQHVSHMQYAHHRAATEPLLALPDAIAWCWAKGGTWRTRIEPAIAGIRQV
ncbi:Uncharacterised protein [Mycobacteroides abscessus subsp. massiliense]|uniref:hypothetical protein n=1 Tax=Mycobacteroides TaxID=670516 RepID=UPI0009A7E5B1|nr:hypothetical protein [Mycobacteroides abscessus]SKH95422.1 Uncharacterised protein [Mycobacteroides abscessus subsp. massiliense]